MWATKYLKPNYSLLSLPPTKQNIPHWPSGQKPCIPPSPEGPCKPPALPASVGPGAHGGAWTKGFSLRYPLILPVQRSKPISHHTLTTNLILDASKACIMFPTETTAILFGEEKTLGMQGNTLKCHSHVYP